MYIKNVVFRNVKGNDTCDTKPSKFCVKCDIIYYYFISYVNLTLNKS